MLLYALTIFLSAFLLFQVEPIIAKIILPWFGGSAAVWATCLLFFQLALLLGYLYAFVLVRRLRPSMQSRLHVALLAVSLLALPMIPRQAWKPTGSEDPSIRILLLLASSVGLPFLLLSSTSPLLQAWYAEERRGALPYRLFALSNAGSMLALVSYPVLVEPVFSTRHQAVGWSLAYAAVAALSAVAALRPRGEMAARPHGESSPSPGWKLQLLWVALAACASSLLLAITNHLSRNVAAIPFLWVLPLSLYLLSFILCFEGHGWYHRGIYLRLWAVALASMTYALSPDYANAGLSLLIPLYSAGLFLCCMVCHGELARLKPHPDHLTSFYLMISLGGALGGVFVGLLAPHVFRAYFELPISMGACAILVLIVLYRDASGVFSAARWKPAWLIALTLVLSLLASLVYVTEEGIQNARLLVRNFYGGLKIVDEPRPDAEHEVRKLVNGTIEHGMQFQQAARRRLPTSYYGPDSGVGLAIRDAEQRGPVRLGVIGLGAGTLAAYGRPGDHYTFYEINPLVVWLAHTQFTFLQDSAAEIDIVLGDARLSLERTPAQGFDVLAVDAFTSDSIPVHLLTREAFELYFRHLKPGGVLAVHVSNKYLDLAPVVERGAESLGKPAQLVDDPDDKDRGTYHSRWVLVSDRQDFFANPLISESTQSIEVPHRVRLWTDDYSNLFRVLK
ncbi:MAG TPA: fused MFS/spermidine synthase [Terriglobia bacterium]|nr:fused MFS/spermidine synthase [Terriglobia bacterium]